MAGGLLEITLTVPLTNGILKVEIKLKTDQNSSFYLDSELWIASDSFCSRIIIRNRYVIRRG